MILFGIRLVSICEIDLSTYTGDRHLPKHGVASCPECAKGFTLVSAHMGTSLPLRNRNPLLINPLYITEDIVRRLSFHAYITYTFNI